VAFYHSTIAHLCQVLYIMHW